MKKMLATAVSALLLSLPGYSLSDYGGKVLVREISRNTFYLEQANLTLKTEPCWVPWNLSPPKKNGYITVNIFLDRLGDYTTTTAIDFLTTEGIYRCKVQDIEI